MLLGNLFDVAFFELQRLGNEGANSKEAIEGKVTNLKMFNIYAVK
jgi:hypothetical protein